MGARIGYCDQCEAEVWLTRTGRCMNGHGHEHLHATWHVAMPEELDVFNWGAFLFPVLWPLVKGPAKWGAFFLLVAGVHDLVDHTIPPSWWTFALLLISLTLSIQLWYARNANQLTWEHRPWAMSDPQRWRRSQKAWAMAGIAFNAALVAGVTFLVLRG